MKKSIVPDLFLTAEVLRQRVVQIRPGMTAAGQFIS